MTEKDARPFDLENFKLNPLSSSDAIARESVLRASEELKDENINDELGKKLVEALSESDARVESPIFKALAEPILPAPAKENRARLQMQSPTRLHFYWSFKRNPFETLRRIFGGAQARNYTLIVKLLNETSGREEIFPVDAEGSWWFDADADSSYLAEIGFHNARAPFVRLMSSNKVETPRKNPSPRAAQTADWSVSADDFAVVLDASGFAQDAFEVALAGDDFEFAETATQTAFAQMFGETDGDVFNNNSSEMRFALLALAAGYAPENLRGQISHSLFVRLQTNHANLTAEKARVVLQENFGVFASDENTEIESLAPTVFGASLINFPRLLKRRLLPKFAPLSSFNSRTSK